MKRKVLVMTDFSNSSRNALAYIGRLLDLEQYDFVLIHIYTLPLTYTVEGVALASISEAFSEIEGQLNGELDWVRQQFPQMNIHGLYVLGGLIESVREQITEHSPELIAFGTAGYYSERWHSDSELLLALRTLPVPVLIIPQHITYHPVREIGFACDYKNVCVPKQVSFIRKFIQQTGARLHVVHVTRLKPDNLSMKQKNEALLREALTDVNPLYYSIENPEVFTAIDQFIKEHQLDILMVIPRKQEFWYSLFNKSNISQLAFLHRLPIMALPE